MRCGWLVLELLVWMYLVGEFWVFVLLFDVAHGIDVFLVFYLMFVDSALV